MPVGGVKRRSNLLQPLFQLTNLEVCAQATKLQVQGQDYCQDATNLQLTVINKDSRREAIRPEHDHVRAASAVQARTSLARYLGCRCTCGAHFMGPPNV